MEDQLINLCQKVLAEYEISNKNRISQHTLTHEDMALHSALISKIISERRRLTSLFVGISGKRQVSVASIGCGPAIDMIGIIMHVLKYPPNVRARLKFFMSDCDKNVRTVIDLVEQTIDQDFQEGLSIETFFTQWDITQIPMMGVNAQFGFSCGFKQADIFVFSFLFGQIFKGDIDSQNEEKRKNIQTNLKNLCQSAKVGSYFLVVDVCDYDIINKVSRLFPCDEKLTVKSSHVVEFQFPLSDVKLEHMSQRSSESFVRRTELTSSGRFMYFIYRKK